VLLVEGRENHPLLELATRVSSISNKNFEKFSKYFSKSEDLVDFDDHAGSPNGRLGASRRPSSGSRNWPNKGLEE